MENQDEMIRRMLENPELIDECIETLEAFVVKYGFGYKKAAS